MIANKKIAAKVSEKVLEASGLLNDALIIVHDECPDDELSVLRRAIGKVLGELLFSVMNPLYQCHPDIKPKEIDSLPE